MIILALWGIKQIASGAIKTATSAVDTASRRIPNVGKLDHDQTLAWRRLSRSARRQGVSSADLQSALADVRASLSGEVIPEALEWFASLSKNQKRDALIVLSGLV
jgi:hypothetical protein